MTISRKIKDLVQRFLGYHDLWRVYLTATDLRPYLWEYRNITRRKKTSPITCPDVWCSYLIALLECGEREQFDQVYSDFCRRGGGPLQLKDYLLLSHLAAERGEANSDVLRADAIYTQLTANHENHAFERFVDGKTVAIVGSGPSERGRGRGHEIDAHDVVIRINNHTVKGFEADYGTRTDVWAKHTTDYLRHEIPDERIQVIVYAANWMRDRLVFGYRDALEKDLSERIVDYCDARDRAPLTEGLKCHPMTGTLLIEKLRHSKMQYLDAYGFSFLEAPGGTYTHYFSDGNVGTTRTTVGMHQISAETAYLKQLFRDGRRLYPVGQNKEN